MSHMFPEDSNEIRRIRLLVEKLVALYKLSNSETLAEIKGSLLRNEMKRKIYDICDGKKSVKDIAVALSITQPNVSYHLASLVEAGLVHFEERNGNRYYHKTLE